MSAWLSMWWMIFRVSLSEKLVYRVDFMLGTLMRFLPIITHILLWTAVLAAGDGEPIGGYDRNHFVAYYLLVTISRAFSSMPGLAAGITEEIRDGAIKKYLIQPVDLIGYLLLKRIAHKLVYYLMAFLPFALIFFLGHEYFDGWPEPSILCAYGVSLLFAFCIGFFMEATLGLIGFWWLEVSSLLFIYMLITFFFSGHMFPLEILPAWLRPVFDYLPFQYLAYFPAALFLEKMDPAQMTWGLWVGGFWSVFFFLTSRIAFTLGVRRYSGFGG